MGRIQDLSGTPLSSSGCLINGFHAFSTPRNAAPLQVYKRASSCAWTRQYAPFDVRSLLCTWTGLMNVRFSFVLCWSVSRRNSSLSTLKQTNVSPHTHWLHERKKPNRFYSETFVLLHTSRSFPSKWLHSCHNKLLFHTLSLWWHTSRCLKSPLKRVFHVLRITWWTVTAQFFCAASVLSRSNRPNEVKPVCFTNPLHSILVIAD